MTRFLDEFAVGDKFTTAEIEITEAMILAFARDYDPQPFHIDPVAAKESIYGGLIASGFQTLALGFRLVLDTGVFAASSMGSPGFDELRWLKPVHAGDRLHVEAEVIGIAPSRSKPDRGIIRIAYRYLDQSGEPVLTCAMMHLLRRRQG
ncbi:MAG TPA: MaoC family dehydratase [Stellaceae bacterium]|jgi:acyl dehydratase|nr:MaoC family dehydratase [Stellaceae bacterium]